MVCALSIFDVFTLVQGAAHTGSHMGGSGFGNNTCRHQNTPPGCFSPFRIYPRGIFVESVDKFDRILSRPLDFKTPSLLMLCCCNIHNLLKFPVSPQWIFKFPRLVTILIFPVFTVFLQYWLCFCNIHQPSNSSPLRCLVFHGRSQYQHKSAHLLHTTRHSMCFSPFGIYPRGISIEAVDNFKRFALGFLAPQVL